VHGVALPVEGVDPETHTEVNARGGAVVLARELLGQRGLGVLDVFVQKERRGEERERERSGRGGEERRERDC